jgi:putative ABC transport system substrate-binding protein
VRWWKERTEQVQAAVTELIALSPDVLVGLSNLAVNMLKFRAGSVPIVFVGVGDPVGAGFVASLARPGGKITGFASFEPSMGGKWLEVLKETVPHLANALVLLHPETPVHQGFWHSIEEAAIPLGVRVASAGVHNAAEIEQAISSVKGARDIGLIVLPHAVTNTDLIVDLEVRYQIPAVHANRAAGALVSYSIDWPETFKRTAEYVDRILRGTEPSELPVQAPAKFELVINLKTAKTLGLDVPLQLQQRADEVIE